MNTLLSLGGWSLIPDLTAKYLLQFIYTTPPIHRLLRLTPSPPNTPAYRRHYGVTFAFVVLGYLLYTLVDKAANAPPNFYEILGVRNDVDEGGLKIAFRQFAKKYHPDRPGVGVQGAEMFMQMREVLEALKDPAVRFAYDRFGPSVLRWKDCSSTSDFLYQGLLSASGYHIAGLAFLLFWSMVGRSSSFTFWRYILYFALLSGEMALILSPSPLPNSTRHLTILHRLFPKRVAFQHVLFMHQLFMFFNVALFRVSPYLIPVDEFADPRVEAALVERTMALVAAADRESSKIIHTELQSIAPSSPSSVPIDDDNLPIPTPHHPSFARPSPVSPQTATALLHELAPEVEHLILEANLKQAAAAGPGPLKSAWEAAVRRAYRRGVEDAERRAAEAAAPKREEDDDDDGEHEAEDPLVRRRRDGVEDGEVGEEVEVCCGDVSQSLAPMSMSMSISPPKSRETTPTPTNNPLSSHESTSSLVNASGYFIVAPNSTPTSSSKAAASVESEMGGAKGTLRMTPGCESRSRKKSVPRTPGELPSPRPSPSPPPTSAGYSSPSANAAAVHDGIRARRGSSSGHVGRNASSEEKEEEEEGDDGEDAFLKQMVAGRMRAGRG